jgi:hypothetical protein
MSQDQSCRERKHLWLHIIIDETSYSHSNVVQPFFLKDTVHGREIVDIALGDFDICLFEELSRGALRKRLAVF